MDRHVTAIYCDDIRLEVGNKLSYMGVYQGKLLVQDIPMVLPKLCVALSVWTPMSLPFKDLRIKILKGETVLTDTSVDATTLGGQNKILQEHNESSADKGIGFFAALAYSPFPIEESTKLTIRAYIDGEELKGPALLIEKTPQQPLNIESLSSNQRKNVGTRKSSSKRRR